MIEHRLIESFWSRVDRSDPAGCWPWRGASQASGYGHTYVGGSRKAPQYSTSHRVAWSIVNGEIPAGLQIDHLCRNRACCNPDHLEPVTPRENIRRSPLGAGARARQTHCKRGHEFTPDNTFVSRRRQRSCRTCLRDSARMRYHARVS